MKIIKFKDYVLEANETTNTSTDSNITQIGNNTKAYDKYKGRVLSMFSNATAETVEKISTDFENMIKSLPENEKGATDMLRMLFSQEKIKLTIKTLEDQKKLIDQQIKDRMSELTEMSNKLKQ